MKKIFFLFLFCLTLSACQSAHQGGGLKKQPPRKIVYLKGKSQSQVKRVMGKPVIVREETPYQLWSYRFNNCSTLIFFGPDLKSAYAETRGDCDKIVALLN